MISMYRLRKGPAVITTIFFTILGASLLLGNTALSSGAEGSGNFLRDLKAVVTVNGFNLTADLAITDEQKAEGLAVKDSLKENEGMLFVYEQPSDQSFWMKDMKFPIDIIWLDSNGTVVHIEQNLQPCISVANPGVSVLNCPVYTPDLEAMYVLETVAGFSQRHNIVNGTKIDFSLASLS
jgi:uncharacterized membrane protein (UPF0127 family)